MDSGQAFRQLGRDLRASLVNSTQWLRRMLRAGGARAARWAEEREGPVTMVMGMGWLGRAIVIVIVALLIIYPLGAWWASTIDDDPAFGVAANTLKPNRSLAIANAAALLDREVNEHGWTPNDTFLWPTTLLDNMPNYQRGILTALAHFTARLAAAPPQDEDLKSAAELLQYPPDVWVWQPSASLWPASSEHKYNNAVEALRRYNEHAVGLRPAVLAAVLGRVVADCDVAASAIDARIANRSGFFFINNKADDVFYTTKGKLYAYYVILKGLERDFAPLIHQRGLDKAWRDMMAALRTGISLRPGIVLNAEPDSLFVTCVLCSEGFYVLRARDEMQSLAAKLK